MFRRIGLSVLPLFLILLSAGWALAGSAWNEGGQFPVALGASAQQPVTEKHPPQVTQDFGRQDAQHDPAGSSVESAGRAAQNSDGAPQQMEQAEKITAPLADSGSNIAKQSVPEQAAPTLLAEVTQTSPPSPAPAGQNAAGQGAAQGVGKAAQEAPHTGGIRLFGTVEFRGVLKNMPKWEGVLAKEARSPSFERDLSKVMRPAVFAQWKELEQRVPKLSTMEKLKAVNAFFNRWPYRTDMEVYGIEDYWATPYEFMKNSGDCEDYAIAKFYALKKFGVPPESMRVVALMDKIRNIGHAVLVVYVDDNAYVLDNLTDLVLSHERFKQYAPQYSVNESYRWAHIMPTNKR